MAQAIVRSVVEFKREPWPRVSNSAKELVKKMLNPDPIQRLTAQQVLGNASFRFILYVPTEIEMMEHVHLKCRSSLDATY